MSSTPHSIELTSEERKKKAEEIVSKWITMQKTIKEEITLDEILLQHMQTQHASLLESYRNFYWSTIKARESSENIYFGTLKVTNKLRLSQYRKNSVCLGLLKIKKEEHVIVDCVSYCLIINYCTYQIDSIIKRDNNWFHFFSSSY